MLTTAEFSSTLFARRDPSRVLLVWYDTWRGNIRFLWLMLQMCSHSPSSSEKTNGSASTSDEERQSCDLGQGCGGETAAKEPDASEVR